MLLSSDSRVRSTEHAAPLAVVGTLLPRAQSPRPDALPGTHLRGPAGRAARSAANANRQAAQLGAATLRMQKIPPPFSVDTSFVVPVDSPQPAGTEQRLRSVVGTCLQQGVGEAGGETGSNAQSLGQITSRSCPRGRAHPHGVTECNRTPRGDHDSRHRVLRA